MTNDAARERLTDLMESVQAGIASIAQAQQEHAKLTATASAAGKRVTVVVNADGVVIQTRFGSGIGDLTYEEIARAVTTAAQDAAIQMKRKTTAIIDGLRKDQSRLPRLSEFIPGMPDVQDSFPTPPEASTAPPAARTKVAVADADEIDGAMEFTDVVPVDHVQLGANADSDVTESGW
ncbi:YbaB/EbfC family nucleoid-associated protein [Nocardia australiensis]|uniref:YbaB/EbfC family nucleoid-associated protein n=1 Tax=Nocardia australiensis TaxID=2887191 RepID=UPI001D156A3D|nr:YbaB/EbfC family nucleoid-associated protein [Nocardia australiensis]